MEVAPNQQTSMYLNKIIILLVFLYGCETWSLTLREEDRLRVFENRMPRIVFGLKRDEVTVWRKVHNEELHNLYTSPNIIRMMKSRRTRLSGHVERMGAMRNAYRILVGKPEGNWEDQVVGGWKILKWILER
jgi:hypothetical protein